MAIETQALQSGLDALTVAILMGRNDPSTLFRVYQHLSHNPKHLLEQARKAQQSGMWSTPLHQDAMEGAKAVQNSFAEMSVGGPIYSLSKAYNGYNPIQEKELSTSDRVITALNALPAIAAVSDAVGAASKSGKIGKMADGRQTSEAAASVTENALNVASDVGKNVKQGTGQVLDDLGSAPSSGEWLSDAMKGFRDGEIIPDSVLERLSSRLRNNTKIIKNEWAQEILEKTGDGAQFKRFKDGSAAILLRPNATRYQLIHELKHYEHWLADPATYAKMGKLEREEFVFKALQESNHWRLFTDAERSHALELIEYYRKLYGN